MTRNILLIGCGRMGGAILRGWFEKARQLNISSITVVEPSADLQMHDPTGQVRIDWQTDISNLTAGKAYDAVLLAIKPQAFDDLLPALAKILDPATPLLSIAAGRTLHSIGNVMGESRPMIRAMPNLPAMINAGITVCCPDPHVTAQQKDMIEALLKSIGQVAWIENEDQMDAVTGLSGSGPAYVYLLIESMQKAGIASGLPDELAETLARQTVIGASQLAKRSPLPAGQLREQVTSPGGTTAAALDVLQSETGMPDLMTRAIAAATARAKALSE